jgi:ABC-type branched-subunit amino acid transport system ATPase component
VPLAVRSFLERVGRRGKAPATPTVAPAGGESLALTTFGPSASDGHGVGLEVKGLRIQYGGSVAVDGLSFAAPRGTITGLIGPNGAGKTTTFNACSGLIPATKGSVFFGGREITRLRPHTRARLGLGRTFQKIEVFESLTVLENVQMGFESRHAGRNPLSHIFESHKARAARFEAAASALSATGLTELASVQAGLLSTGHRRLVELARALAGGFTFILLDEPSSGLDSAETHGFGEILRQVVSQHNIGLLLVEHDMSLVRDVCSKVYVLDFGHLVFEGTPEEMQSSEIVRDAYLGSDYVPAAPTKVESR